MRTDLLEKYAASLPDGSRQRATQAKVFLEWLGDRELNAEAVRDWIKKLRRKTYADGTIAIYWSVLRRMYKVNGLEWPFRKNDAPVVRENEVYAPALAPEIIRQMVAVVRGKKKPRGRLKPTAQHAAFLALSTIWGLRRIEMVGITPGFIDNLRGTLFVETAKHGRQRHHVIPKIILPYLERYGFKTPVNVTLLSKLFNELKDMVGFRGEISQEVGWHAIRRMLTRSLLDAGIPLNQVNMFGRWKRGGADMALRYGSTQIVGRRGKAVELPNLDREVDEVILAHHPFLRYWGDEDE